MPLPSDNPAIKHRIEVTHLIGRLDGIKVGVQRSHEATTRLRADITRHMGDTSQEVQDMQALIAHAEDKLNEVIGLFELARIPIAAIRAALGQ